jgi:hypothetical protein
MHAGGTERRQAPAWAAYLPRHLGQGGPLTAGALTERLQAHHPGLTAEQVERELRARPEVHEGLPLADDGVLRTRWALSPQEPAEGFQPCPGWAGGLAGGVRSR